MIQQWIIIAYSDSYVAIATNISIAAHAVKENREISNKNENNHIKQLYICPGQALHAEKRASASRWIALARLV